jgi:dihydrofolate reductase
MTISLIVAAAENNVIGKDNKLPWTLPADMKYFKNITWAMPVVMGRKTFEALGKPLTGRTNIVITRNKDWSAEGVKTVKSIDEAIIAAAATDAKEIFVIGGGEIFKSVMSSADKIYLTRVHHSFEGDAFFPEINKKEWEVASNRDYTADEKNPYSLSFQVWQRKSPVS